MYLSACSILSDAIPVAVCKLAIYSTHSLQHRPESMHTPRSRHISTFLEGNLRRYCSYLASHKGLRQKLRLPDEEENFNNSKSRPKSSQIAYQEENDYDKSVPLWYGTSRSTHIAYLKGKNSHGRHICCYRCPCCHAPHDEVPHM